jgi:RimJ/RimL family protein N-acetyltransferase
LTPMKTRLPLALGEVTLRCLRADDASDLLEYRSNPEVARYQYLEPDTAEVVATLLEIHTQPWDGDAGDPIVLAAEVGGKVVGDCSLTIVDPESRQGEVGFAWHPGYTGRGLATRAVTGAVGFAFEQVRLHKVTGAAFTENDRAWRLMERIGMRREAHFLHDGWCKGRWVDVYVYGFLEDDWRRLHPDFVPLVSLKG